MRFVFIETPDDLLSQMDGGAVRLATDNPLLAHHLAHLNVLNLDALIGQRRSNHIGRVALDMADAVDMKLRSANAATVSGIPTDEIRLAGVSSRLFGSLLHRSEALRLGLEQTKAQDVVLRVTDQLRFEPSQPLLPPRLSSPGRALAEAGFFGTVPVQLQLVEFIEPATINDTASPDLASKCMILPPKVLRREVLNRLGNASRGNGRTIHVGGSNEVVREALPELERRGFRLHDVGKLMVGPPAPQVTFDETPAIDSLVAATAETTIEQLLRSELDFTNEQIAALVTVSSQHISAALINLARRRELIGQRVSELAAAAGNHKPIILTNGLFGPYGALAYAAAKRKGFLVVDAEHGVTTGLAALSDVKIDYSEASTSDVLLCSTERAARSFSKCSRTSPPAIHVVGLADQTRKLYRPRLQSFRAKRRLGVQRHQTIVMHVSTLPFYGNIRPGLSAPSETTTFEYERSFVEDVYNTIPATVLYKPYPTQSFPFEPGFADIVHANANVRILPEEDFRYIRAAADIVVSMTPTSTLGWCVGLNRPFVWLHTNQFNRLTDTQLAQRFEDAFLFVDLDQSGWRARLRELLSLPLSQLRQLWQKKSEARSQLLEADICGPDGNVGTRAAEIIAEAAHAHQ